MKAEKLVEACSTLLEVKSLVWACAGVEGLGPLGVVKIAQDVALEMMTQAQLAGFAWQLREMAEGIEKWNTPEGEIR